MFEALVSGFFTFALLAMCAVGIGELAGMAISKLLRK